MKPAADKLVTALADRLDGMAEEVIRSVLAEVDLSTKVRPPKRVQLTLRRLRFDGERRGDVRFHPGVNVIRAGNFKGKTTILQLIQFCLTGSDKLKPDMKKWISEVDLDFDLDGIAYTVHVDRSKRVRGFLDRGSMDATRVTPERLEFTSSTKMEATLESFFSEQFGLEQLAGTQKDSRKDSDRLLVNQTSYGAYFQGLYIDQESGYAHLVTDTFFNNQYMKIVGMLLGLRGLRPYFEAEKHLALTKNAGAKEEAHVRRTEAVRPVNRALADIKRDLEAATQSVDELRRKRAEALVHATSSDADRDLARLTNELVAAHDAVIAVQQERADAERARDEDETTVVALKEAIASKHHFSALTPHHCPVCEATIPKARTEARHGMGQCLLCAADVKSKSDQEMLALLYTRLAEAEDSLKGREVALQAAQKAVTAAQQSAEELAQQKQRLQTRLRAVREDSTFDTQIENEMRRIGKLEAERDDALSVSSHKTAADGVTELALKQRVLEALVSHFKTADGVANEQTKARFAARVLDYLHKCGISNIESLKLDALLKPQMVQNGESINFTTLSAGEKVRFVLAFFFAMAVAPAEDIPTAAHPGLLLIDSPGKEEMVAKDFKGVVDLLRFIDKNHAEQVQAIVATTYQDIRDAAPKHKRLFIENDVDFVFP